MTAQSVVGVELIKVRIETDQVGEAIVGKQVIKFFWPKCALLLITFMKWESLQSLVEEGPLLICILKDHWLVGKEEEVEDKSRRRWNC